MGLEKISSVVIYKEGCVIYGVQLKKGLLLTVVFGSIVIMPDVRFRFQKTFYFKPLSFYGSAKVFYFMLLE